MAAPTWISDIRNFMNGMAKDVLKRILPPDRYLEAENVTVSPQKEGVEGGLTPNIGNTFSFSREEINIENDADDYKAFRIKLDLGLNVPHEITYQIPSSSPVVLNLSSSAFTSSLRYDALVAQINADPFLEAYIVPAISSNTEMYIGVRGYGSDFSLIEEINSESTEVFIIKEFYGNSHNGVFTLLKAFNIGPNEYQLETNGTVFKWSVAKQDRVADTWQYVTLLQTTSIVIPIGSIIDVDGEINNNVVSIYFTGSSVDPRALYVDLQETWAANSAMLYDESFVNMENEDGYFTYDNVDPRTKLQILENTAITSLSSVNDSGGGLKSGSKQYTIRQSIGTDNASGFYFYSNPIPIFVDPQSDPSLSGNVAGVLTTKSITLVVSGLNPLVYDFYELVCIENNDGAITAYIVGQFPVTSTTDTIIHTGFETTTAISTSELNVQQIVIKSSENLVITRNRLFLSNTTLSKQPDLSEWAQTITITTARTTLAAIGNAYSSVNEYQKPENVNQYTGYMPYETYRFGFIPIYNNKSPYRGVGQPVFIADYTIDPSIIGNALTDNAGIGTPDNVYVYYPEFSVDLSTVTVDGVPLNEILYGYQIVRQRCIPEVLATGLAMPAAQPQPIAGFYTCGSSVAIGGDTYLEPPDSSRRTQISFISPDIQFENVSISPQVGDKLFNFGQVYYYNNEFESVAGTPTTNFNLLEYSSFEDGVVPVQHVLSAPGETVEFNSDGILDINGAKLRNLVSYSYPGFQNDVFGNNQRSLALPINDFINPINTFQDQGLYYCQYRRTITNKYGDKTKGEYISTGHLRVVDSNSSYVDEVFGGDTFAQKNFIKFCNYYTAEPTNPSSLITRTGISYISHNRNNYQLRNFTDGTNGDYPYTTTSLVSWLGVDELLEGQLQYSLSYTPTTLIIPKTGYNKQVENSFVSNETSTMRYSQLKIQNTTLDSYRQFLPLDFKSFPSVYGSIKNTFNYGNSIIVMMDQWVGIQQVDLQQQQTDPNNQTSIIIGDGTVLGAREQDLSFIGAPIKTAGYTYLSTFGKKYFVWFNPYYKKVIQYTGQAIRDLFEENQMQSFLTQNTDYIKDEASFFFCYDYRNSELLMFAKADIGADTIYDPDQTYTKDQIVYTEGGYTTTKYYIATQDVPLNKQPFEPANMFQYWKPYRQSNFAIAYNEKENNITTFYSFSPVYPLMTYQNTFLSTPDALLLKQNVYEHNRFTNKFYEDDIYAYVHTVFNMQNKIFKHAISVFNEINAQPLYLHFIGENNGVLRSFNSQSDIKRVRNYWWANVKNDSTVTPTNPTGSNSIKTQKVGGEFIEAIIIFENGDQIPVTLSSLKLKMALKPRNFGI